MKSCIQNCGYELPEDEAKFCVSCGAPQCGECPHCDQEVQLTTSQCSNPHCRRFFRYCPSCHKLFPLSQEVCDNQPWGCSGTPLVDFFQGYSMRGANARRTGSVEETIARLGQLPGHGERFSQPVCYLEDDAGEAISSLATGYGHFYFVSRIIRQARSVREDITEQVGPHDEGVTSSKTLPIPVGSQIYDVTVADGVLAFLAYEPHAARARYPSGWAVCLGADDLEERMVRPGPFQTHLVVPGFWILMRYEAAQNRSVIDVLRRSAGPRGDEGLVSHALPKDHVVDEGVPPVATPQGVFFTTKNGEVFRLLLPDRHAETQPPVKFDWISTTKTPKIAAMAYGMNRLHLLTHDGNQQQYQLYATLTDGTPKVKKSDLVLDQPFSNALWIQENCLYLLDRGAKELHSFEVGEEFSFENWKRRFPGAHQVPALLPIRISGRGFALAHITSANDSYAHFKLYELDGHSQEWLVGRFNWGEPELVYSNGRAFLYDKSKGRVNVYKVFQ